MAILFQGHWNGETDAQSCKVFAQTCDQFAWVNRRGSGILRAFRFLDGCLPQRIEKREPFV
ncbi:MAG: hypothetical protein CMJ64_24990 [Planctomycetaceae bacterium]|nr:hypothetical protein [Planctomycetaceae bacterium]